MNRSTSKNLISFILSALLLTAQASHAQVPAPTPKPDRGYTLIAPLGTGTTDKAGNKTPTTASDALDKRDYEFESWEPGRFVYFKATRYRDNLAYTCADGSRPAVSDGLMVNSIYILANGTWLGELKMIELQETKKLPPGKEQKKQMPAWIVSCPTVATPAPADPPAPTPEQNAASTTPAAPPASTAAPTPPAESSPPTPPPAP